MEWQPIETAPKDGVVVLGWRYYPIAMRWNRDTEYPWEAVQLGSSVSPMLGNGYKEGDPALTHWMPLPEAPN